MRNKIAHNRTNTSQHNCFQKIMPGNIGNNNSERPAGHSGPHTVCTSHELLLFMLHSSLTNGTGYRPGNR